ncbi:MULTISPECIES: hypothetical protein [Methylobacterium]|uniref:hypothetical protein n=1 Tax=Methylobacterium TaxID=407 RepID=UPI000366EB2A|nr:hypothetical protein [Methylobacterium sp. 285MFTsu5.1]MBE7243338.1 hypothetical protein [Actinomycetospora chiangmaiensis]
MAGKKVAREQLDWGPCSRRRRRVRPEIRKAAARSLAGAMALVLVALVLIIAAARYA